MKHKRACVVINPHAGQNVTQIADLIAVLSAAGWSTEIVIKEYGGHSMELAARAAKANFGLDIGYGGDGTLNHVLNGVMRTRKHSSLI
ncbi:MAG: diacylglycerol/lipid kinase family protein, partial [Ktedonobacteraceae bacterium]